MSQKSIRKILAIVNPAIDNKKLVNRLARIAKVENASVTAYCCIFSGIKTHDLDQLVAVETRRYQLWLDEVFAPLREKGVEVDIQLEWNEDWQGAVERTAANTDCDLIVRDNLSAGKLKTSNRELLRSAPVPVLFLSSETPLQSGNILTALKLYDPDEAHDQLNRDILDFAEAIKTNSPDCVIHAATCCSGWEDIQNPRDISRKTGIDHSLCHYTQDDPDKGIADIAKQIDAEMILIGAVPPDNLKGRLLGTTAEKVLNNTDCDIIVVL